MASASSEHDAGEAPAKKPWSRPTLYVLTDVIESHGGPTAKTHDIWSGQAVALEDESAPPNTRYKNYVPTSF